MREDNLHIVGFISSKAKGIGSILHVMLPRLTLIISVRGLADRAFP